MIVMKFGGTSVESAAALERIAAIVRERLPRHPVVVVSAMGKTTNRLLAIAAQAAQGNQKDAMASLESLKDYHRQEALQAVRPEDQPMLPMILDSHFHELAGYVADIALEEARTGPAGPPAEEGTRGVASPPGSVVRASSSKEFSPQMVDAVSALGERISSQIVALAFRRFGIDTQHVDSRSVIVTDSRHTQAAPNFPKTYARLAQTIPPIAAAKVPVMGGFIGSTPDGITTTLGRGGSDYTASIVGAGIGAEEIQIWTDVDGMLTCDPTILPGGHRVKRISFAEAAELAYFGAKVLHPATVLPAIEKNIPVLILNSRRPQVDGTRITAETVATRNPIKSIACKRNITVLKIQSLRMLMAHGFLRRIFEVFDRYETPVDMLSTSEVSVSVTIDNPKHIDAIRDELAKIAEVTVESNRAIVCVVGDNIRGTKGIGERIFRSIKDINVLMISQGSSQLNFGFVINQDDLLPAVTALHKEFFAELDPEVFD